MDRLRLQVRRMVLLPRPYVMVAVVIYLCDPRVTIQDRVSAKTSLPGFVIPTTVDDPS